MVSFHNIKNIKITNPRETGSGFTNELYIDDGENVFRIDFFGESKAALKVQSEDFTTLRSLIKDLLIDDEVLELSGAGDGRDN